MFNNLQNVMGVAGQMTHLMDLLKTEFEKHWAALGNAHVPTAEDFTKFAVEFMGKHRPSRFFHNVDANLGIELTNGTQVLLAPPAAAGSGDMQPSGYVPITGGRYTG